MPCLGRPIATGAAAKAAPTELGSRGEAYRTCRCTAPAAAPRAAEGAVRLVQRQREEGAARIKSIPKRCSSAAAGCCCCCCCCCCWLLLRQQQLERIERIDVARFQPEAPRGGEAPTLLHAIDACTLRAETESGRQHQNAVASPPSLFQSTKYLGRILTPTPKTIPHFSSGSLSVKVNPPQGHSVCAGLGHRLSDFFYFV